MTTLIPPQIGASDLAIVTRNLSKQYGSQFALHDVSLHVPTGAVYVLVGPNGAGKSTTIKLLLDLIRPTGGSVEVLGLDAQQQGPLVRANIGYVPEQSEWGYPWMRVRQLLDHHRAYFPQWDAAYAERLSALFHLKTDSKVSALSKGEARRVHLTMALAHRPPVLILDEPTDGLDPIMRDETMAALVDHLAETPTTVLISTHRVEEVQQIADHIGVLNEGTLRTQLPTEALRTSLRRYRAIVPDGWQGASALDGAVLQRTGSGREIEWIMWGDERDVTAGLTTLGASVTDVTALSFFDATLALLKSKG